MLSAVTRRRSETVRSGAGPHTGLLGLGSCRPAHADPVRPGSARSTYPSPRTVCTSRGSPSLRRSAEMCTSTRFGS